LGWVCWVLVSILSANPTQDTQPNPILAQLNPTNVFWHILQKSQRKLFAHVESESLSRRDLDISALTQGDMFSLNLTIAQSLTQHWVALSWVGLKPNIGLR
jgi:hypothetical protein